MERSWTIQNLKDAIREWERQGEVNVRFGVGCGRTVFGRSGEGRGSGRWLLRGEGEGQGWERREGGWERDFPDKTDGFLCFF